MSKTTVVYHRSDFDGLFCREIARKFLLHDENCDCLDRGPDAIKKPCNCVKYIGWDFGDPTIDLRDLGEKVYVMDLPLDKPFVVFSGPEWADNDVVWIDHHKTAIETHPTTIPGYRIDGVAACRLAWQWFATEFRNTPDSVPTLPSKQAFLDRAVSEPLAVRLAGEYDIWDHRGDGDLEFQFGLRSIELTPTIWSHLLSLYDDTFQVEKLIEQGRAVQYYQNKMDARMMSNSFLIPWHGLNFLAINSGGRNSNAFAAKDVPETNHDALLAFYWNGKGFWVVSLYHAKHRTDLDLSIIAKSMGGGGHRGACGFTCAQLPFTLA